MKQVERSINYTAGEDTAVLEKFDSEYIWPAGWVINGKYTVGVSSSVTSESSAPCQPYSKDMVGALPAPAWVDRTSPDWWDAYDMQGPSGDKNDWTPYYWGTGGPGEISTDSALWPRTMDQNENYTYWWTSAFASAIRLTFTIDNPDTKLWVRFDYADANDNWTNGAVFNIESGVPFVFADNLPDYAYIYKWDLIAADNDPWDFYEPSIISMFSMTSIEFLAAGTIRGWVDVTDVDYWNPRQEAVVIDDSEVFFSYGEWDPETGSWIATSGAVTNRPYYEVWLDRNGSWSRGRNTVWNAYNSNYFDGPGIRPEKIRVWYESLPGVEITELPGLYVTGEYSEPLTRFDFANTGYVSGTEAELFFDDRGFQGSWEDDRVWDDIKGIDLFNGNDYNDFPYRVTRIELFMEIPQYYPFKKHNYADSVDPHNVDIIMPGFTFTRDNDKGIYNLAQETVYDDNDYLSPLGTEWALEGFGFYDQDDNYFENPTGIDFSIENAANLYFTNWAEASDRGPGDYVGRRAICHFIDPDIYMYFFFDSWTTMGEGGGFSYRRTRIDNVT